MEVAGVVFRSSPCFSSSRADAFPTMKQQSDLGSDKFSDQGHLQYYNYKNGPRMAMKEKEIKKKLKLLKGLSKKLSDFSDIGFGLNPVHGLDHQVKGQMVSEATEVLLEQLQQQLKADKLESKQKKKEEKAKKKASRALMDSSESSSSSSESDCENPNGHQKTSSSLPLPEAENRSNCEDHTIDDKKKIEVCMGGKCKKSGGAVLLENLQKAIGGEEAVVGCKCMGKCRDGPNVRVRSNGDCDRVPVCIGVGLEDVDMIVTNFFGGNRKSTSDMVPV